MKKFVYYILAIFACGMAEAQLIHDDNALFKMELRAECYNRYGTNPGCGAPLEEWMKQIDRIVACQVNYAKGLQRINETLAMYHGRPEGTEFEYWRFGNVGVTQYVVPQLAPFHEYDLGVYPTLSASLIQHRSSGVDTMRAYIAEVNFNHWFDGYFRMLRGKPVRPPLAPPTFN